MWAGEAGRFAYILNLRLKLSINLQTPLESCLGFRLRSRRSARRILVVHAKFNYTVVIVLRGWSLLTTTTYVMKLLAVHPSCLMYSKIYLRLEPLGLELVASAAREEGHDVRLIDLQAETHKDYFRWIRSWSPDAIVFSCNYLANVPEIIDLAKATRTLLPEALIMVGGHSASFTANEILQHGDGSIDAVLKVKASR